MTTSSKMIRVGLIAALVLGVQVAGAADLNNGKEKATTICAACHGPDGLTVIDPSYPKLAGQYPDYLARALTEYKSGTRKNPIMAGLASTLSKKDIEDVAAYYASLPSPLKSAK